MPTGLFEPLNKTERLVGGFLMIALGVASLALAGLVMAKGFAGGRVWVALICMLAGLYNLVVASRLFLNRSPRSDQRLIAPWLMIAVGSLLVAMDIVEIILGPASWVQTAVGIGLGVCAIVYGSTRQGPAPKPDKSVA
jgi:hypothetical protein